VPGVARSTPVNPSAQSLSSSVLGLLKKISTLIVFAEAADSKDISLVVFAWDGARIQTAPAES
jgi:hypothetical protein